MGQRSVASELAPAIDQINQTYNADINTAQTVTGGQAGAYGALAQTASNRRNRAALGLVPMSADILEQKRNELDNLLTLEQRENYAAAANEAQLYELALNQYNTEAAAIGAVGSLGRQNLHNTRMNMVDDFGMNLGKQLYRLSGNMQESLERDFTNPEEIARLNTENDQVLGITRQRPIVDPLESYDGFEDYMLYHE
jgi:hypothetical protein